jgi:hypothetical protein
MSHENQTADNQPVKEFDDNPDALADLVNEAQKEEFIAPMIEEVTEVSEAYQTVIKVIEEGHEVTESDTPFLAALSAAGEAVSGVPLIQVAEISIPESVIAPAVSTEDNSEETPKDDESAKAEDTGDTTEADKEQVAEAGEAEEPKGDAGTGENADAPAEGEPAPSETVDHEGKEQVLQTTVTVNPEAVHELQGIIDQLNQAAVPHELTGDAETIMQNEIERHHNEVVDLTQSALALESLIVALESVEVITPTQAIIAQSTLDILIPEESQPEVELSNPEGVVSAEAIEHLKRIGKTVWEAILKALDYVLQLLETMVRTAIQFFTSNKRLIEKLRSRLDSLGDKAVAKREKVILGTDAYGLSVKTGSYANMVVPVKSANDIVNGLEVLQSFNKESLGSFLPGVVNAFDRLTVSVNDKTLTPEQLAIAADSAAKDIDVSKICPTDIAAVKLRGWAGRTYDKAACSKPLPGGYVLLIGFKDNYKPGKGTSNHMAKVSGFDAHPVDGTWEVQMDATAIRTFTKAEINEVLRGLESLLDAVEEFNNAKLRNVLPASIKKLRSAVAAKARNQQDETAALTAQISALVNGYNRWIMSYTRFIMGRNRSTLHFGCSAVAKMLAAYGNEHFNSAK